MDVGVFLLVGGGDAFEGGVVGGGGGGGGVNQSCSVLLVGGACYCFDSRLPLGVVIFRRGGVAASVDICVSGGVGCCGGEEEW